MSLAAVLNALYILAAALATFAFVSGCCYAILTCFFPKEDSEVWNLIGSLTIACIVLLFIAFRGIIL